MIDFRDHAANTPIHTLGRHGSYLGPGIGYVGYGFRWFYSNVVMVPQVRLWPLSCTTFPRHYSLIIH
jgi:hypothetical protein